MASLSRRVESKETLLRTIVDVYADGLNEAFEAVMASKGPDSERLYAIMRVFAHASRHFREESRIVVFGWYGREAAASPVHDYFVATQRRLDALTGLFGRGLEDGTVRPHRPPAEPGRSPAHGALAALPRACPRQRTTRVRVPPAEPAVRCAGPSVT